jgi:predicted ribosomally synthesized peptide with nif11-like leader
MSEEQLKAFLEKVKDDTSLQEKLKAAADVNSVAAIAKEAGFMISADDLTKAQSELSDEELEGVAGGISPCPSALCLVKLSWLGAKIIETKLKGLC